MSIIKKFVSVILSLAVLASAPSPASAFELQIDGGGGVEVGDDTSVPTPLINLEDFDWYRELIGGDRVSSGKEVRVGLITTNFNAKHPDLTGQVLNGYDTFKDQVIDINLAVERESTEEIGTAAAGLIAGKWDDRGIRGVYPNAKVIPITIDGTKGVENSGDKGVAKGIDWAVANGVDVIAYVGGLTGAFIVEKESESCKAITRARDKGVLTITSSGSQYEASLNSTFLLARCKDAIKVAPISQKLGEANGFRNTVPADLAAPAVSLITAKGREDWLEYNVVDDAELASAIVAGGSAWLISQGFKGDALAKRLLEGALDIGAKGFDPVFGAGVLNLTGSSVDASVVGRSSRPRILSISSDEGARSSVSWEPAVGFDVSKYFVVATRYVNGVWQESKFEFPSNQVRGVIDFEMGSDSYISVVAVNEATERASVPSNSYSFNPFEGSANPYAKVLEVKAKWDSRGIVVDVVVNKEGQGESWYVTLLDGWSLQPLLGRKVEKGNRFIIPYAKESPARSNPHYILATINGERISVGLPPEFLLTGSLLGGGKGVGAVVGESSFACNQSIGVVSGCEGAVVKVIDSKSKKVLGKGYVLSDLTFAVYFKVGKQASVYVSIDDKKYSVRSSNYVRVFNLK